MRDPIPKKKTFRNEVCSGKRVLLRTHLYCLANLIVAQTTNRIQFRCSELLYFECEKVSLTYHGISAFEKCATQTSCRPEISFCSTYSSIQGPKLIFFFLKECFYQTNVEKTTKFSCAGQIKSFHGPHLARGAYVEHALSDI